MEKVTFELKVKEMKEILMWVLYTAQDLLLFSRYSMTAVSGDKFISMTT